MGKLRLILNSIIKYNINSITGKKNNTKNLFSCSVNRNLKKSPNLYSMPPNLYSMPPNLYSMPPNLYSNNNLHLKVPQRNNFSKSWFKTIFILPRMPCNSLKSKWNPYFTFREQSKYRTVWNWKYVDYNKSTHARDVYQIYGTKDRRDSKKVNVSHWKNGEEGPSCLWYFIRYRYLDKSCYMLYLTGQVCFLNKVFSITEGRFKNVSYHDRFMSEPKQIKNELNNFRSLLYKFKVKTGPDNIVGTFVKCLRNYISCLVKCFSHCYLLSCRLWYIYRFLVTGC